MSDLKLDAFGDLDLSSGDLELVTGIDAIIQHIRIRLRFVLGEWHLDRRLGIPYFGTILVKSPDLSELTNIFSEAIRETPGVLGVDSLTLELEGATRTLTVNFSARLDGSDTPLDFYEPLLIGDAQ